MSFESCQRIHFGDVDQAGIMYFPRIFHLCHLAFEEMWEQSIGRPYHLVFREEGLGFPAVHIESDFHHPLHFGDDVVIKVSIPKIGKKSVTFNYDIMSDDQRNLLANIKVTTVCMDIAQYKPVAIPEMVRSWFEKLS